MNVGWIFIGGNVLACQRNFKELNIFIPNVFEDNYKELNAI